MRTKLCACDIQSLAPPVSAVLEMSSLNLNHLAGRLAPNAILTGDIMLNGQSKPTGLSFGSTAVSVSASPHIYSSFNNILTHKSSFEDASSQLETAC